MSKIKRALMLRRAKCVIREGNRYPPIDPIDLHEHLRKAFEVAKTVGDRHHPSADKIKDGSRCIFFEQIDGSKNGKAVLFHAYIYTAGHIPDQIVPDLDAAKAEISFDPIVTEDGDHRELVERVACLVFGEALIIENARVYGSAQIIVHAIRALIRRHVNAHFPNLYLSDAPNRGFKAYAESKGGVKEVTVRVASDFTPEADTIGSALESIFKPRRSRYRQVSATIVAERDGELDPDEVEEYLDEREGSTGLTGIFIKFADTTTMTDLDEVRERHVVELQEVRPGVPAVNELETEMREYLKVLMTPDTNNARVLTTEGIFT